MSERLVNDPATTLTSFVAPTDTTIAVYSTTGFPTSGNFRIRIDDELLLVTAVSGNTWTVTRGIEGTTAVAHLNASTVNAFFTAGGLLQWSSEVVGNGTYANLPITPPQANSVYACTDAPYDFVGVGGAWQCYGPAYRLYVPPSGFSWVNPTGNTSVTVNGTIAISCTAQSADQHRLYLKTAPTPPYSIHARWLSTFSGNDHNSFSGVYWYENSSGKGTMIAHRGHGAFVIYNISSLLGPSYSLLWDPSQWHPSVISGGSFNIMLTDDGTTRYIRVCPDGVNYQTIWSGARGTGYTTAPDKVGIGVDACYNSVTMTLLSWREF